MNKHKLGMKMRTENLADHQETHFRNLLIVLVAMHLAGVPCSRIALQIRYHDNVNSHLI